MSALLRACQGESFASLGTPLPEGPRAPLRGDLGRSQAGAARSLASKSGLAAASRLLEPASHPKPIPCHGLHVAQLKCPCGQCGKKTSGSKSQVLSTHRPGLASSSERRIFQVGLLRVFVLELLQRDIDAPGTRAPNQSPATSGWPSGTSCDPRSAASCPKRP